MEVRFDMIETHYEETMRHTLDEVVFGLKWLIKMPGAMHIELRIGCSWFCARLIPEVFANSNRNIWGCHDQHQTHLLPVSNATQIIVSDQKKR